MTERRINVAQAITYNDGTMQPGFRDFIFRVDNALTSAGLSAVWGELGGTLSSQTDLATALNGKVDNGANVSVLVNDAGYLTEYTPPEFRSESTDPYTLVLSDANKVLRFTTANAAVTIPAEADVNFPVGTEITIRQASTGTLVLTTTGLTFNGSLPTWSQHVELKLRKVTTDVWDVI